MWQPGRRQVAEFQSGWRMAGALITDSIRPFVWRLVTVGFTLGAFVGAIVAAIIVTVTT